MVPRSPWGSKGGEANRGADDGEGSRGQQHVEDNADRQDELRCDTEERTDKNLARQPLVDAWYSMRRNGPAGPSSP
jgi:hypothetical protein